TAADRGVVRRAGHPGAPGRPGDPLRSLDGTAAGTGRHHPHRPVVVPGPAGGTVAAGAGGPVGCGAAWSRFLDAGAADSAAGRGGTVERLPNRERGAATGQHRGATVARGDAHDRTALGTGRVTRNRALPTGAATSAGWLGSGMAARAGRAWRRAAPAQYPKSRKLYASRTGRSGCTKVGPPAVQLPEPPLAIPYGCPSGVKTGAPESPGSE